MKIENETLQRIQKSYTEKEAVERLSKRYANQKEQAFFDFVLKDLRIPSEGQIVEIGGGAGLQGVVLKERFRDRYLHSDYSKPLVEKARELGLESQVVDGLAMPFSDRSLATLILIGPSTIINDEATRRRQLAECARVLVPEGQLVMATGRLAARRQNHCLDRKDVALLESCGFELERYQNWGIIPGRFWNSWNRAPFSLIEKVVCQLGGGVRRVVVAKRSGN